MIIRAAIVALLLPASAFAGDDPSLHAGCIPTGKGMWQCGLYSTDHNGLKAGTDQYDQSWHLLTQTEGGQMQLTKNLSQHECEFLRARALNEPATDTEKAAVKRAQEQKDAHNNEVCKKIGTGNSDDGIACNNGKVIGWLARGEISRISQPGDIKSAECFQ